MKGNAFWTITFLTVLLCGVNLVNTLKQEKAGNNNLNILNIDHLNNKESIITFELTPKRISNVDNLALVKLRTEEKTKTTHIIQNLSRKVTEYSGKVKIGNPPQEFEMVFDTGSANFIIASSKCSTGGCAKHKKYDSSKSTSSKEIERLDVHNEDYVESHTGSRDKVVIRFGTGNVQTYMTEDTVCLGQGNNFCVDNLLILEAFYESDIPFSSVKFDGIIGLSFSHLSVNPKSNFLDMLTRQNKVSQKVFSFYFNKNDMMNSQIHIGGINVNKFQGDVYFSNVVSKNYWEIKIDEIYYGEEKLDYCGGERICTAIVDTGTSMLAYPDEMLREIVELSLVDEDCSNISLLKNLKFKINGVVFNLDPEFYVMKIPNEVEDLVDSKNLRSSIIPNVDRCMNAYMQLDALSNEKKLTIILGIPFLKKYYTVFDREQKRIGFAVAKH